MQPATWLCLRLDSVKLQWQTGLSSVVLGPRLAVIVELTAVVLLELIVAAIAANLRTSLPLVVAEGL